MQKDWDSEFAEIHKNLGKLNYATKEAQKFKKNPAAYMDK